MEGAAPVAVGYASCEPLRLTLRRSDLPMWEKREPVNSGTLWDLRKVADEPGEYELSLVHAAAGGARVLAESRLRIVPWDTLTAGEGCAPGVGDNAAEPGPAVEEGGDS